jgi:hypothetical protein
MREMCNFVNNVWFNFIKAIQIFYEMLIDQKYIIMSICRIFWQNLDIIVIIMC